VTEGIVRDRTADARDDAAERRDDHADKLLLAAHSRESALLAQLQELRAEAGAERARAAKERARAAAERARLVDERARLEAELKAAHSDDLTGAYRREAGRTALAAEIDRARRADGRFVIAFVDVDRLKEVNDRDGHAAGDQVLETVVRTLRAELRSYDPIVRYGGDEFVCGLGGMDVPAVESRFESIGAAVEAAAGVGVSVGVAALGADDTADDVIHRADLAMLEVKARRKSRRGRCTRDRRPPPR
jgi:diguanylate cyclase (GGDEF)-like protein